MTIPAGAPEGPLPQPPKAELGAAPSPGSRRRRRRQTRPSFAGMAQINNEIWLGVAPIAVFLIVGRFADTRIAIGAGFGTALLVFSRTRTSGVIRVMAIGGIVIVGGAALVGVVLNSDKAFLASDALGDFLWALAFAGSLLLGRPLVGVIARETLPGIRDWLPEGHRVFIWLSVAWALQNLLAGGIRIVLLDSLSAEGYILWSRVIVWPLNGLLIALSFYVGRRAIMEQVERRLAAEPPEEDGAPEEAGASTGAPSGSG